MNTNDNLKKKESNEKKNNIEVKKNIQSNKNISLQDIKNELNKIILEKNELKKQLLEKEDEAEKNLELAKYLQAELSNIKKRHEIELINSHRYAITDFAKKILNILDSIEQGINYIKTNKNIKIDDVKAGLEMTNKMFINTLKDFKIELIQTNENNFDPEKHEAISIISNQNKTNNSIIDTVQKGYMINNRLLRYAKVVVCKNN